MDNKIALYRKYRPKNFGEVKGQDHIVDILKNAVSGNRISHAYLFAGPRGTGKTSVARILAKEAGCSDIDLLEIDAASSRGIDEIRALRDAVHFAPLQGSVKVYVIDEVHMLTKEAFNALLKTLEEPPKHVIFILATTELDKVPETIVSRCQHFTFRKVPENILREAVVSIADKEGFKIDDEAAGIVALSAEGSFRDAEGMLDQILSLGDKNKDKKISGKEVRDFFAVPSREAVENFISAIIEKSAERGLEIIQQSIGENVDMRMFLKLILRDVRAMLLLKMAPRMKPLLEKALGEREFKFVEKNKDLFNAGELEKALKILLDAHDVKSRPYLPQLPLELAFLKIIE
ncbi:DNA polymerase III subunit gamma/tau [Patescibacteria group bacterium]|nr:DNA polymerase III subunit gamma/tau [Patescibacteria group bacterium]MBU4353157.1 DNA polymerase III subunit gamma/tau [Patescibacteria group bacterium]MBU4477311.1 DNA polymerase III subunit gamma/tau [Patescibacteria group bacterium]MCG2698845.1 DNA polymerase III subunit gamma/tau [Candidatus Parcubacteria bacterium]